MVSRNLKLMHLTGHLMGDKMRLFFFFLITISATSCSVGQKQTTDSPDNNFGWLHGNCLAIKNANIPEKYQFTLVRLDNENTSDMATIVKKATNNEDCYPLLDDRASVNIDAGYFFYTVKSEKPINLAMGILESEGIPAYKYIFSYCNNTEGIKFSVSTNNSSIWEGYYYLGYESEPTCTSE